MRTRYWDSEGGTTTAVQYREDTSPAVWLHSNLGWLPIGNTPGDPSEAEKFAEDIAQGYELVESSEARARRMADWPEEGDPPMSEEEAAVYGDSQED